MTVNSGGDTVGRRAEFELYDSLPPDIRKALQDAPIHLGASTARKWCYHYGYKGAEVTMSIRDYMLSNADHGTQMSWTYTIRKPGILTVGKHDGTGHPQADKNYKWPDYQLNSRRTRVVNIRRAK